MEVVRTIKLYGPLAAEFGHVFRFAVNSVAEASSALCKQVPGFEKFMMESKDRGLEFAIFADRDNLGEDKFQKNLVGVKEIRIVPVVTGAKRVGVLQIIAGAVLIVAGAFVSGLTYGWAAPVGKYMIGMGISMIVGGVVQLLSPQPKMSKDDRKDDRTSYAFNGAINVQAQGASVPVLYGEMFTGSVVVSAGISAEDNYVVPSTLDRSSNAHYSGGGSFVGQVMARYLNAQQ